ncbi:hypothetical protein EV191_105197 [Tamaricihabitans halophyticus]|uniref:DUF3592 domain-containing protein n=1 Tax=Tamaricihabitans halophyticus TaxID=1262583 RepID=A0A4R2QV37_9PSEU|nr:DUF3592 domain-containing protein [Tamaricihabitans halophyticus]TCP53134.1 hypothetical protein EV191_105197 [Tamaricihabitans halophyticus]
MLGTVLALVREKLRGRRPRRIVTLVVTVTAATLSFLCITLVFAAWQNDRAIGSRTGFANAEVISVDSDRSLVRFQTPDEMVHIPPNGVLYPGGLAEGQVVRIEYDQQDPELARVAGRNMSLTLLPVGSTMLITWAIAGPILWWLRRPTAPSPAVTPAT